MKHHERRMALSGLEVREASDAFHLSGYASTFNEPYDMGWFSERVDPMAFRETLGRRPDVRLLVNHDGLPLARTTSGTLSLDTDSRGLRVAADLDPSDPDVAALVPKMRRGDLSQMSFSFRVAKGGDAWSPDMSERTLTNLDLNDGDVSVVTYPANPGTSATVRSQGRPLEAVASALRTLEERAADPAEVQAVLQRALGYFAAIDSIVDDAQAVVADALGVPNPDVAQDAADGERSSRAAVSDAAWDGSAARFTIEQWRRSCLVDMGGNADSKDNYKLPVREPDGTLNRNAVHNAAARISQLDAPASVVAAAKEKLAGIYRNELHEDVPDSLRSSADLDEFEARRLAFLRLA
jgi:HK97 family phage prohead protease